ncbi:MAG: prolyl oligopeptidase family serine peptidase [Zavarzinella sp.]
MPKKNDDDLPYGFRGGSEDDNKKYDSYIHDDDFDKPPQELAEKLKAEKQSTRPKSYSNNTSTNTTKSSNSSGGGCIAVIAIIVIKVVILGVAKNGCNNNNNNNPNIQFQQPQFQFQQPNFQPPKFEFNRNPFEVNRNPFIGQTFAQARGGFKTTLIDEISDNFPTPVPPKGILEIVQYPTELGNMDAYITPKPAKPGKYPAIIWLSDGFSNSIDTKLWAADRSHVSGKVFRDAGFVVMYPSLRGGNKNPGSMECGYGEVDDVLAAHNFLQNRDDVDPTKIFLVGHGNGGTLALLTAAYRSSAFRGVLAFGPVSKMDHYDEDDLTYDTDNPKETVLRSPINWLKEIKCSTWVVEGRKEPSNVKDVTEMSFQNLLSEHLKFSMIVNFDHDTIVEPAAKLYINKISDLKDNVSKITFNMADDFKIIRQGFKNPKLP